jgi:hypothetical protein
VFWPRFQCSRCDQISSGLGAFGSTLVECPPIIEPRRIVWAAVATAGKCPVRYLLRFRVQRIRSTVAPPVVLDVLREPLALLIIVHWLIL